MGLPLTTLSVLNRQDLSAVFKDPKTLSAFERFQLQVAQIIPETFTAFQNLDFVVTAADAQIPNAHVITAGANISVTTATGLVTLKATPSGPSGQIQYNNGGTFGSFAVSGDATLVTSTGVLTLATVNANVGTFGDATHIPQITVNAKGLTTAAASVAIPTFTSTTVGFVPASGGGTVNYLRADGTFAAPPGSGGTVTSVASADGSITVTNPSTTVDLAVVKAPKWTTARTLSLTGAVTGSASIDGSGNIALATTGGTTGTIALAPPGTRLSLVTGNPRPLSDVVGGTHIYCTPDQTAYVPVYNGASWDQLALSADLDMALDTSNQLINQVYDLFVYNNSGSPAIGAGPSWTLAATVTVTIASPAVVTWTGHGLSEGAPVIFTTSGALPTGITAGTIYFVGRSPATNTFNIATSIANASTGTNINTSGSQSGTHTGTNHTSNRGTGAGTTQLARINGIWTNANSITLTNGAGGGVVIAANKATYVGSSCMTANGQTTQQFGAPFAAGGSNPKLFLYNAYNRMDVTTSTVNTTSSWSMSGATWQPRNLSTTDRIWWLDGLAQGFVETDCALMGGTAGNMNTGMSANNTNGAPVVGTQTNSSSVTSITSHQDFPSALGVNYAQAMQYSNGSNTAFGQANGVNTAWAFLRANM